MFNRGQNRYIFYHFLFLIVAIVVAKNSMRNRFRLKEQTSNTRALRLTTKVCIQIDADSIRAKHKSCFLRPDTGPCRADIIQWYFDAMRKNCYRFFWGGCQGNGNKFEDRRSCMDYCASNTTMNTLQVPYFCNLAFDFGTCFGHFNRWAWDRYAGTCKRRLYSGCGGNQNNFETRNACMNTCLNPPNNTMSKSHIYTTCFPFTIGNLR
ncbi:kunitz-type serine protease inhibitor A-like [Anticarsia gemmatalis]|uniref:kunitz-type serine protease inhibitor A-like n=1 Tax=Anticarsia gemmatalis TaxID=129554 RepID=UPI003F757D9C